MHTAAGGQIMSENVKQKKHPVRNTILVLIAGCLIFLAIARANNENDQKYMGHGFDYMHGYSSTDFTGYHVYEDQKLYHLDHTASLIIENEEDFPVLDGAEACYPVYSALALASYRNIASIEKDWNDRALEKMESRDFSDDNYELMDVFYKNGRYVTFTNSSDAYYRLVDKKVDMVFAARPSLSQKQYATSMNEEILTTPIGKEAFVFFTQASNPVENLTSDQIRSIYHGDITNWKEVGGKNQKIVAFQRPEESGSQVMMHYFMGDVSMADPKKVELINVGPMGGIIEKVAEYYNEAGALGYTFKYFLTGLNQEENVKILSVDGIFPTSENIKNGTYPAVADLVCATLASNKKPSVKAMMDFILSDDGQEIIEQTGYAALFDRNVTPNKENELTLKENEFVLKDDPSVILKIYGNLDARLPSVFELISDDLDLKGNINQVYKDAEQQSDQYYIFPLEGNFEILITYDPDQKIINIVQIEYNRDGLPLPEGGSVFVLK